MRRFAIVTGGFSAATLLSAAMTLAQPVYDPMAAAAEAPAYDALHPPGTAAPATAATTVDPMAAAAQPQDADAATVVARGEPNPELDGLPDGPGAEETYYQCVACHSTAIIKQQRVTPARWDYLWQWMVDDQGMVDTDEETKALILTYLKQNFGTE